MGRRHSTATLEGHQLLQHLQGWTWAELDVCSWTAIIPRVWLGLQLTDSSTPLSAPTFRWQEARLSLWQGFFLQEKSHLFSSQEDETLKAEQLPPPASRKAQSSSVPLLGKGKGGNPAWGLVHRIRQHQLQQQFFPMETHFKLATTFFCQWHSIYPSKFSYPSSKSFPLAHLNVSMQRWFWFAYLFFFLGPMYWLTVSFLHISNHSTQYTHHQPKKKNKIKCEKYSSNQQNFLL